MFFLLIVMDSKKIAIISECDIHDRKGVFNAVINRSKHLIHAMEMDNILIDVFFISRYDPFYVRWLRKSDKLETPSTATIEGVTIKIVWFPLLLCDWFFESKLGRKALFYESYLKKKAVCFKNYDLIISHSFYAGILALNISRLYNISFVSNWHGSDIHTNPINNKYVMRQTRAIMRNAKNNCFVSKSLLNASQNIFESSNKIVLYNGCDESFFEYSDEEKKILRTNFNVVNKNVISFVGNFYAVKNVLKIPIIFEHIYEKQKNVVFWMIGDGKYRSELELACRDMPVFFWGNRYPSEIPLYLNCTDVLILPSKNEAFGLVLVEGILCGCHAVGSRVGGIPEVVGVENTVSLENPNFEEDFATLVLEKLKTSKEDRPDVKMFNWQDVAKIEKSLINQYI